MSPSGYKRPPVTGGRSTYSTSAARVGANLGATAEGGTAVLTRAMFYRCFEMPIGAYIWLTTWCHEF